VVMDSYCGTMVYTPILCRPHFYLVDRCVPICDNSDTVAAADIHNCRNYLCGDSGNYLFGADLVVRVLFVFRLEVHFTANNDFRILDNNPFRMALLVLE